MKHDVFISHSPYDLEVAEAACLALERRGLSCWIASRDAPLALAPDAAADQAIGESRLFLLILSANAAASPFVRRESELAALRGVAMASMRIEDVAFPRSLAFHIGAGNRLDALTPPIASHLDHLGDHIAQLLETTRRGPLLPTMPPGPLPAPRGRYWLPIAGAGLAGLAAIAMVATYVARPAAQNRSADAGNEAR